MRPRGLGWIAALAWTAGGLQGGVIIHEIHYNEPGAVEAGEFVELHNTGPQAADLSGWSFTAGISYEFPQGTVLGPADYILVAADPGVLRSANADARVLGPYEGVLSNSGEELVLRDAAGRVADRVEYDDGEDWPPEADGDGASLELLSLTGPRNFPGSWGASKPPTPGAPPRLRVESLEPMAYGLGYSPARVTSADPVTVTARVYSEAPLGAVLLRLEAGGPPRDEPMRDDGAAPDAAAGDGVYTALVAPLPEGTFAKFKVVLVDASGGELEWPRGADESDYHAWLVHDGGIEKSSPIVWIFLSPEKLKLLEAYAQVRSSADPLYPKFDATFDGFVVLEGRVHRKVAIRHRGGFFSRHAGRLKYSWRLRFPDWDRYQGRRVLIVQGNMHYDDPWMRGDNGLKDKLCFMTFDRAGGPSSRTRFIRLMVNGELFGYHVELEAVDETYLERNGYTGRGDLYKHGRTFSAHNFPLPGPEYARAYEKQTNDTADTSSIREICEGLAAASGGTPGSISLTGRIWSRDGGTRPEDPTFSAKGLTGFSTSRTSVGLLAYKCLAEFDEICLRGEGTASCDLLEEDGNSIDEWRAAEGEWEADGVVRLKSPNAAVYNRLGRVNVLDLDRSPVTLTFDVRILTPRSDDNWAGVAFFLGNPGAHAPQGSICPALRFARGTTEGLHVVSPGSGALSQSGQFPWSPGEWYRIECTLAVTRPGDGSEGLRAFLDEAVELESYGRYLTAIALTTHWDSTNQNYYFYRDDLSQDRWVRFPWDMDITWGYSRRKPPPLQGHNLHPFDGTRWNPEPNEFATNALREAYLGIPELRDVFRGKLARALETYFTEAEIHPVVDRIVRTDGAESQLDIDKWNGLDRGWDWRSFEFHADFDKAYVTKRRKYLAEFLDLGPILSQPSVGPLPVGPPAGLRFRVNALGSRYDGRYDGGPGNLRRVSLHLVVDGVEEVTDMAPDGGDTDFYMAVRPLVGRESMVFYRFMAEDDRGRAASLPHPDRDGHAYFAFELGGAPPGPGDVVVNEILYHPRYYDLEFIELKNNLYRAVDLSGWTLRTEARTEYSFPQGTILEPAGYLVLSRDGRAVFEYYNVVNIAREDLPFSLGNGGDFISLEDSAGGLIDVVVYEDRTPWAEEADGGGPSLELIDSRSDNSRPEAWAASAGQGTPGRPNSVSAPERPPQPGGEGRRPFHRGDADASGKLDLTDAVAVLSFLFLGATAPRCLESADANDDGVIDLTDAIAVLRHLFLGGEAPAPPGPPGGPCSPDPEGSPDLGCTSYPSC
ncbi:MAG TPA: lamin tail domain-containing protein [Planctomycetota bacterium]|nr:lamin tail domain-containing protein [Planctomycetota bacterium]